MRVVKKYFTNLFYFFFIFSLLNFNFCSLQYSYLNFILDVFNQIKNNSNQTIFNQFLFNDSKCADDIFDDLEKINKNELGRMFDNSGKSLMDLGNQDDCEIMNNKTEYVFLKINISSQFFKDQEADNYHNLFLFTDQEIFFIGFCLWKNCKPFYTNFFENKINAQFYLSMYDDFGINNITYEEDPRLNNNISVNLISFLVIFLLYLILRIIIVIIGEFIIYKDEKKNESQITILRKNTINEYLDEQITDKSNSEYYLKEDEQITQSKIHNLEIESYNSSSDKKINNLDLSEIYLYKSDFNISNQIENKNLNTDQTNSEESSDSSISSDYIKKLSTNKIEYEKDIKNCINSLKTKIDNYDTSYLSFKDFIKNSSLTDDSDNENNFTFKNRKLSTSSNTETLLSKNLYTNSYDNSLKLKFLSFYKIFSFTENFNYLFEIKNEIYNDRNIEIISGLRSIVLFGIAVERVVVFFYSLSYDLGNISLYYSFGFSILKLATFAVESSIFLDGFTYTFKLMSYIKKENKTDLKTFLKFFFNITEKIVVFVIMFFIVTIHINEIANLFEKTYIFSHFYKILSNQKCMNNPYEILIPFYMQYFSDLKCEEYDFDFCLKYVYHCIGECYCMFFTVILFYLVYKFKSKTFDKIFSIFILINILGSVVFYLNLLNKDNSDHNYQFYNFKFVLGETRIIKQPHILFTIFFMGINCGLVYFYFIESLSNPNKFTNVNYYYPFSYNFNLMRMFIKFTKVQLIVIGIITISLIFLISSFFIFLIRVTNNNNLLIEFDLMTKLIFIYEKKIFIFLFSILTLCLLFSSDKFLIIKLLKSKFFVTFSRISFNFICLDILVYFFLTIYDTRIYWNYQSILMIVFAIYCILGVINLIVSTLIQLPVRIIYKKLTRDNKIHRNSGSNKDNYKI